MCHWTMGLNSDKTSKVFFVLIFGVILPDFISLYHSGTESSKFHHNCGCFWPLHPIKPERQCAVSSNDQHQGNGCVVEVLVGCDRPSFAPISPLVGELWHFQCFPTWLPSAILNFKNFNIWSPDCYRGPNLPLCTKFHQNWFTHSPSRRS